MSGAVFFELDFRLHRHSDAGGKSELRHDCNYLIILNYLKSIKPQLQFQFSTSIRFSYHAEQCADSINDQHR